MVITINPNYINGSAGNPARNPVGERPRQQQEPDIQLPAGKAQVNYIPGPESLQTLVRGAQAALRQGNVPDRGSILNILT